nr:ABC transporter substrate-binding protein [Chelatococcus sp. YT9]
MAHAEDKVRIATASTSAAHAPLTIGMVDPTIFGKNGISIEVTDLRGASPNCIAALLSKAVEICQVGTPTGTDAIVEGADLKAVAVLTGPINEIFLSAKTVEKLGISPDAPIEKRIAALKGLSLTTSAPGTAHYLTLGATLEKAGLTMNDIRFRTLGDVPAMVESIRNGQIDGSLWTIGSLSPLLQDKSGVRWISMARGDVDEFRSLPYVTAYARADWVAANPDLVNRIHKSYADAIVALKTDRDAPRKIKERFAPDLDQALWDDGFNQLKPAYLDGAATTRQSWQQSLDMQAKGTGKNYATANFDTVLIPAARAQ